MTVLHPERAFSDARLVRPAHASDGPVMLVHARPGGDVEAATKTATELAAMLRGEVLGVGHGALAHIEKVAHEADLIVTPGPEEQAAHRRFGHLRTLLKRTGRPVLLCQDGGPPSLDRALVCWNDSPQARRATVEALPLLRRARLAIVLLVCEAVGKAEAEARACEVERGLKARGVNARAVARAFRRRPLAEVVRVMADDEGADLVVAGAYGRSALSHALGGSHTDALLAAVRRPFLLSC